MGNGQAYIEVMVAQPATATFINLRQNLLQRLHGCTPADDASCVSASVTVNE